MEQLDDHSQKILKVRSLMRDRDVARENGNFVGADGIRDTLKSMGVFVIDQKSGPSGWKFLDGTSNKLKPGTKIPPEYLPPKLIPPLTTEVVDEPPKAAPKSSNSGNSSSSKKRKSDAPSSVPSSNNVKQGKKFRK